MGTSDVGWWGRPKFLSTRAPTPILFTFHLQLDGFYVRSNFPFAHCRYDEAQSGRRNATRQYSSSVSEQYVKIGSTSASFAPCPFWENPRALQGASLDLKIVGTHVSELVSSSISDLPSSLNDLARIWENLENMSCRIDRYGRTMALVIGRASIVHKDGWFSAFSHPKALVLQIYQYIQEERVRLVQDYAQYHHV